MIKRYWKLLVLVLITLFLVLIFDLCASNDVSSRWMGFLGGFIGGIMTLVGMVMTIEDQHKEEQEDRRIENMPLLSFDIKEFDGNPFRRMYRILCMKFFIRTESKNFKWKGM